MREPAAEVHEALRSLAASYAAGVDRRQLDLLLSAFHPDATLAVHRAQARPDDEPLLMRGRVEIGRVVELIARYPRTFHLLGQGRYEVDGDRASGEVYCVAHHYAPSDEGARNHVMYIRYHDVYRRDDAGTWKIERRDVRTDWTETRRVLDGPERS
jgi:ketosteroid isomerase-like protein